jgi:hypothetical protein
MIKMDPAVIAALRDGEPLPDPKLEALHRFTTIVVRERGFASDPDVEAFLAAGHFHECSECGEFVHVVAFLP